MKLKLLIVLLMELKTHCCLC